MSAPQLLLFDPNLKTRQGHNLEYAARVFASASAAGIRCGLIAGCGFQNPDGDFPFESIPVLEDSYWHELGCGPGEDPNDHLARVAFRFSNHVLEAIHRQRIGSGDVLFFPCANLSEAMGMVRVAVRLGDALPRTVLLFRRELDEQGSISGIGPKTATALFRQTLADLYSTPGGARIRLFTDSDALTEEYREAVRRPFQTAPIPVDPELLGGPVERSSCAPVTLMYIGDARSEKGYQHLPAAARKLLPDLEAGRIRFVLQSNFNTPAGEIGIAEARTELLNMPGVLILDSPLTGQEYLRRMLESDLILLPYEAGRYVTRTSGILAEAIVAAKPVVVPAGTWMSDQLLRHGAGVLYQESQAGGFAGAVGSAVDRLDRLSEKARRRRFAFAEFHNPARLVRFVCGTEILARALSARQGDPDPNSLEAPHE